MKIEYMQIIVVFIALIIAILGFSVAHIKMQLRYFVIGLVLAILVILILTQFLI